MKTTASALFLICALVIITAATVFADMLITTRDGKQYTVPVDARDVLRIEYTDTRPVGRGEHREGARYLGCFRDQGGVGTAGRDLSGFALEDHRLTTEKCVSLCRDKGFRFAGTQSGRWCFCGDSYGRSGKAGNCDVKCAGNSNDVCGGEWANSVYDIR